MSKQFTKTHEQISQQRMSDGTAYSARIQEVMRYDKLPSADYPIVMGILNAVLQGYTEARWKEVQEQPLKALTNRPPDKRTSHADATNRYEQTVCCLKDLMLWPW